MKTELFIEYGCYIGSSALKLIVTHSDELQGQDLIDKVVLEHIYPLAREATEGWDGQHGFEGDEDEDGEGYNERMEDHAQYFAVLWDEREHASKCTYSPAGPDTDYLTI